MTHKFVTQMYLGYFGLASAPFSIAPDPRYLFMSAQHQEALATLLYGLGRDGGFILLTGEVGAGKTTICRRLLERVPETCDVAYIFNPKLTATELLSTICDEFRIPYARGTASIKIFVDLINAYLLASHANGRHAVLIIDEAQNLSSEVLEQLRLLTNLETSQRKLLQVLLIGQPELVEMLAHQRLRQLAQRIVARYHLSSLARSEVAKYVKHRLEVAGAQRPLFPPALIGALHRLSGGIPRIINLICDRALLGTFVQGRERVDRKTLHQAAREVLVNPPVQNLFAKPAFLSGLAMLCASTISIAAYQIVQTNGTNHAPVQASLDPRSTVALPAPSSLTKVKPVTVVAAAQKIPGILDLPEGLQIRESKDMAYATLLRTWGLGTVTGEAPCRQVERLDMQCHTERGSLEDLRRLNLPVILDMLDRQGNIFNATLSKLDADSATFSFGSKTQRVSFSAFALQWSGTYTVLLHQPQDLQENIRVGDSGPSVEWLRKQLGQVQGGALETTDAARFDSELEHQVKTFQLAQGLVPDGSAGPRTLVRLCALADRTAPRLYRKQEE